MELKNDLLSYTALSKCVVDFYKLQKKMCVQIGETEVKNQGFFGAPTATQKFLIGSDFWIWVHLSTGGRDDVCGFNFASHAEANKRHLWNEVVRLGLDDLYDDRPNTDSVVSCLTLIDRCFVG